MEFSFTEIETFILVLIAILTFIVLIYNAIKAIKALAAPVTGLADRVAKLEAKVNNDWDFQQEQVEFNKIMMKSIRQLIKHELDDNDKDGLLKMEMEIDEYLVEK